MGKLNLGQSELADFVLDGWPQEEMRGPDGEAGVCGL